MKHVVFNKGLVCGLILLLAGPSIGVVADARSEHYPTIVQDDIAATVQNPLQGTMPDLQDLMGGEAWQQVQHAMANETAGYLMYSSSGSGNSLHLFMKIPHLRNSKGFCLGGVIVYTGLTALTMIWRIVNGTAADVVKMRPGPHVVVFAGVGYSFFLRNKKGGTGRIVAVSFNEPSIIP
jgi:hypothetical protein